MRPPSRHKEPTLNQGLDLPVEDMTAAQYLDDDDDDDCDSQNDFDMGIVNADKGQMQRRQK
jgi:hypothetical protein